MSYGIRLKVWGDHGCFTRPEMQVERVSYDVMTPSARENPRFRPCAAWKLNACTSLTLHLL